MLLLLPCQFYPGLMPSSAKHCCPFHLRICVELGHERRRKPDLLNARFSAEGVTRFGHPVQFSPWESSNAGLAREYVM